MRALTTEQTLSQSKIRIFINLSNSPTLQLCLFAKRRPWTSKRCYFLRIILTNDHQVLGLKGIQLKKRKQKSASRTSTSDCSCEKIWLEELIFVYLYLWSIIVCTAQGGEKLLRNWRRGDRRNCFSYSPSPTPPRCDIRPVAGDVSDASRIHNFS